MTTTMADQFEIMKNLNSVTEMWINGAKTAKTPEERDACLKMAQISIENNFNVVGILGQRMINENNAKAMIEIEAMKSRLGYNDRHQQPHVTFSANLPQHSNHHTKTRKPAVLGDFII